ncbi:1-phosphofructokinase family hexose kinase [Leifsonia sp. NPDC014704]|uniref:1-phosphofructokinase family hexose kinase n=1 Tax=Leifsonia sp. NPDC014704 TaxID=3364123 RepID=UPI0036F498B7
MTRSEGERPEAPSGSVPVPAILVVGPNPAMDRTEELFEFRPHEVNRAHLSSPRAGGKSFIVARALRRLGHDVSAYGFLGGAIGRYLRDECQKLGIRDRHTEISDDTRINTILVDERTRLSTVINEPGPTVSPAEVAALTSSLADDLREGDLLVLTGSLPRGAGDDFYASLIALGHARGARTIVDADGAALLDAAGAIPWAIKCNAQEFTALAPDVPDDITDEGDRSRLVAAMQSVVDTGVALVIVTLGASGLLAVTATHVFDVSAPAVETKNATGSGDSFLAGFTASIADGAELATALCVGAAAASANAAVLIPDIGPDPDLSDLLARTHARVEPLSVRLEQTERPKQTERLGARP